MADSTSVADASTSQPTSPESAGAEDRQTLELIDLERLGRARPASLPHTLSEVGFVIGVVGSLMMSEYFISGFNVILPQVSEDLEMTDSLRTWPAGVFGLTTAALLLPFARLGDQYGARNIHLGGHTWLLVWSTACGFSRNYITLIVCRAMQGIGVGAFMPNSVTILSNTYRPGPRKNMVFALYGAMGCLGFYFGILMAGICAQLLNWTWFFWIGAICEAMVLACSWVTVPKAFEIGQPGVCMDWYGLTTIVPGLCLTIYALTDGGHAPDGWHTPYIYATFIVGVLFLCGAVYVEGWISEQPLLPGELFRTRYMRRITFALLCTYGVFGLVLFYGTFYFQTVLGTTPLQSALWFTPLAGGGFVLALIGGFILHLISGRVLLAIGGIAFVPSGLLLALMPEQSSSGQPSQSFIYWAYIFPAMICATLGVDIMFNVTNVFITTSMPIRLQAAAGGLITSLLYLGNTLWLGIAELAISTTVEYRGGSGNIGPREQYQIGFWVATGLAITSMLVFITVKMEPAAPRLTADEKNERDQSEGRI